MKKPIQLWEKYGVSEKTFLFVYTAGYNSTYSIHSDSRKNPYPKYGATASCHKIWAKARRDAKKF